MPPDVTPPWLKLIAMVVILAATMLCWGVTAACFYEAAANPIGNTLIAEFSNGCSDASLGLIMLWPSIGLSLVSFWISREFR